MILSPRYIGKPTETALQTGPTESLITGPEKPWINSGTICTIVKSRKKYLSRSPKRFRTSFIEAEPRIIINKDVRGLLFFATTSKKPPAHKK
jgi:hypothetical protein